MLAIKIKNREVEKYLRNRKGLSPDQYVEKLILSIIRKDKMTPEEKLKLFNNLIEYNQQFDLTVDPEIDISELANEVNNNDLF